MSKSTILQKIGLNKPVAEFEIPHFKLTQNPASVLKNTFVKNLKAAGAQVIEASDGKSIETIISNLSNKATHISNLYSNPLEVVGNKTPIDLAIIGGALGVAENGAIWVDSNSVSNGLIPFICTELILILNVIDIVSTMHEAYEAQQEIDYHWGSFIAGPSKTADIEQTLVIGAQGAMKLNIILLTTL